MEAGKLYKLFLDARLERTKQIETLRQAVHLRHVNALDVGLIDGMTNLGEQAMASVLLGLSVPFSRSTAAEFMKDASRWVQGAPLCQISMLYRASKQRPISYPSGETLFEDHGIMYGAMSYEHLARDHRVPSTSKHQYGKLTLTELETLVLYSLDVAELRGKARVCLWWDQILSWNQWIYERERHTSEQWDSNEEHLSVYSSWLQEWIQRTGLPLKTTSQYSWMRLGMFPYSCLLVIKLHKGCRSARNNPNNSIRMWLYLEKCLGSLGTGVLTVGDEVQSNDVFPAWARLHFGCVVALQGLLGSLAQIGIDNFTSTWEDVRPVLIDWAMGFAKGDCKSHWFAVLTDGSLSPVFGTSDLGHRIDRVVEKTAARGETAFSANEKQLWPATGPSSSANSWNGTCEWLSGITALTSEPKHLAYARVFMEERLRFIEWDGCSIPGWPHTGNVSAFALVRMQNDDNLMGAFMGVWLQRIEEEKDSFRVLRAQRFLPANRTGLDQAVGIIYYRLRASQNLGGSCIEDPRWTKAIADLPGLLPWPGLAGLPTRATLGNPESWK